MYTLGINAAFHDSSAALMHNGRLVAAAEEERFTHIKHGKRPIPFSAYELPFHAIDHCLSTAGIRLQDVNHVSYSFDPSKLAPGYQQLQQLSLPLKPRNEKEGSWISAWDPLFLSHIINAPNQLTDGYPHHLQQNFSGPKPAFEWHFTDHHLSHAASAFLPSPFETAAVMVIDGRGEQTTTSYYIGINNHLQKIGEVLLPHSLGLLYEDVTRHLGFLHSSDEYKVMALASYGRPVFLQAFRDLIHIGDNGNYTIDQVSLDSFLGAARKRNEPFEQVHFDIAHSLQKCLEETVLHLAQWLRKETGQKHLCLAGGVALNCVLNAVLKEKSGFEEIWVQPAAGDAGTALGAAMWTDAVQRNQDKRDFTMDHVYWGPDYSDNEIEAFLKWAKLSYKRMDDTGKETAQLLAENKVVAWYQGKMEFGPRALGSRSILASPIDPGMQQRLNEIKDREDFRPVAPVVLEEYAGDWFENAGYSPFMLFVYKVKPGKAARIPTVTHVDGTARVQTVNAAQHPQYYQLIDEFRKLTGVPVLVNTSFNTRGKPIVCSPRDAVECFWTSPFDALVINSFLVQKNTDQ